MSKRKTDSITYTAHNDELEHNTSTSLASRMEFHVRSKSSYYTVMLNNRPKDAPHTDAITDLLAQKCFGPMGILYEASTL